MQQCYLADMSDGKDHAAPLSVLLATRQRGDGAAFAALFEQAYAELKRILSQHEIAELLKLSVQIVDRKLRFAKSWLNTYLESAL